MSAVSDQDEWAHGFSAACHGDPGVGHTPLWRDGHRTAVRYLEHQERERRRDYQLLKANSLLPADTPEALL